MPRNNNMPRSNIDEVAAMNDWPQDRIDAVKAQKNAETSYFQTAPPTAEQGDKVEELARNTDLAKRAMAEQIALTDENADQDRIDRILS